MTHYNTPAGRPMRGNAWLPGEHILWRFTARLMDSSHTPAIEERERAVMAEHLAACETCRAGLAALDLTLTSALAGAADTESPSAANQHPPMGKTPDDLTLSGYATLLALHGQEVAQDRYPDVAMHIVACELCQKRSPASPLDLPMTSRLPLGRTPQRPPANTRQA